jgi:hypothetical protein
MPDLGITTALRMSVTLTLLLGPLASCSDGLLGPCECESYTIPDFIGTVHWTDGLRPTRTTPGGFLLIDVLRPKSLGFTTGDTVWIRVGALTAVFLRAADSTLARADTAYPEIGETIQVWHTGVELRSYPPQYSATRLEIFRDFR